jgi:hypothetical protein
MCSICMIIFILLNRHIPKRGVLNLVGDRRRIDGDQRTTCHG